MFLKSTLLACLVFLIISCGENQEKKKEPLKEKKKIEQINFFMEVSGSMAGYLNGNTEFRSYIPNFLVNIEGKIDSGNIRLHNFYIADSVIQHTGSTHDFIASIATKNPAQDKSSQMHKIFEMIAQKTDSNDISIFVSDCILSYPDDLIRNSPSINQTNASGDLKSSITRTFLDLKRKNIAASIYGFSSSFNGTYYDFQNNKLRIAGNVKRPYYIWVLGNRDLLMDFNRQLQEQNILQQSTFCIDFGLLTKPVDSYYILFNFERQGDWETDYSKLTEVSVFAKKPARFAIALDLGALPLYAQDTAYLRQTLKIKGENILAQVVSVNAIKDIDREKLKPKERNAITGYTHVCILEITEAHKSGNLDLVLPLSYDTAYKRISIMDDRNVEDIEGKTFALEHLIDGVRIAYQDNSQNFIQLSIPVKD